MDLRRPSQMPGIVLWYHKRHLPIEAFQRLQQLHYLRRAQLVALDQVAGAGFEGVTYVDGVMYAVDEDGDKGAAYLLAFEWQALQGQSTPDQQRGERLVQVGRWKLDKTAQTEGIAYVPDEEGGKLYISSEKNSAPYVSIFEVPRNFNRGNLFNRSEQDQDAAEEIFRIDLLNGNLLSEGFLIDESKIASLAYFEDVMYILHDNARVVRGWDLKSGIMVSEWKTPRVGRGFDKQWEGLALQRVVAGGASRNLRGSEPSEPDSTLYVHLSLDTPPQVWSFAMKEQNESASERAEISFPSCAAAF